LPLETYERYESGDLDIPISVLYKISNRLGTDTTVLLTGDDPRMETASVCRAGKGIQVERYPGYDYSSLAYNFKGRTMEPLLVTLDTGRPPAPRVRHSGQEFNYVVKGRVRVSVGNRDYDLEAGDSLYFDARLPHAQCALANGGGNSAQFITIIQE
ncbi:MAG: cupin domain-containing protein, partial [Treponema sp.]|nr:cupin domain-containing protein [Treponema sp.]